jgi:hypothetical protein
MRTLLLLALMACGTDAPTPFDRSSCDGAWGSGSDSECDLACEAMPQYTGSACEAGRPDGHTVRCGQTFSSGAIQNEFSRGCCVPSRDPLGTGSDGALQVWFFECQ